MLRLALVNTLRSGVAPRLFGNSCSILHGGGQPVSKFSSSVTTTRGLLQPKVQNQSNNNRIVRKYTRGDRSDGETRTQVRSGPTIKERMMAPPSENGKKKHLPLNSFHHSISLSIYLSIFSDKLENSLWNGQRCRGWSGWYWLGSPLLLWSRTQQRG